MTAHPLVTAYAHAAEAYRAATRAAKRRHAAGTTDWNNDEAPRLRKQYDDLMLLRTKAGAREGACAHRDCIELACTFKPDVESICVPIAIPLFLGCGGGTSIDVEAAPLRASPICAAHLRAYAKSKNRKAWLKRNVAVAVAVAA